MSDPDRDAEPERRTDPRFDAWPVQRYDAHTRWPIERATPEETEAQPAEQLEWVGVLRSGEDPSGTYVYDKKDPALVEGRIEEERERIVVDEDAERRELDDEESLGEHIEAIGEEHGWTWLSSFARRYLEDDEGRDAGSGGPDGDDPLVEPREALTYEHSSFDRKNLLDSAAADLAFVASHAFSDADDRTYVLEREFDVFLDESGDETGDSDGGSEGSSVDARVAVREDVREATGAKWDRQAGDAALADRSAFELTVDVDPDDPARESVIEEALETWHRDHRGPVAAMGTGSDLSSVAASAGRED